MDIEKIIIRREFNPYTRDWGFVVGFPQDEANIGNICTVSMDSDCKYFEPYGESSLEYFLSRKIVHKSERDATRVQRALEGFYNCKLMVVERRSFK